MHGFLTTRPKCWGRNDYGQLGVGDTTNRGDATGQMGDELPSVDVGTGRSVQSLAVGDLHTCALLDDFSVKCWGSASEGQLGYESTYGRGHKAEELGDHLPVVDVGDRAQRLADRGRRLSHLCSFGRRHGQVLGQEWVPGSAFLKRFVQRILA